MADELNKIKEKITELENSITDLKKRWPAHSLKPEMFAQLEFLEDQLEHYQSQLKETKN